jgi:hypothetical protein
MTEARIRRVEHIAHHEAGHAVAAVAFRKSFRYVTIEPDDDSLGHIIFQKRAVQARYLGGLTYARALRKQRDHISCRTERGSALLQTREMALCGQ